MRSRSKTFMVLAVGVAASALAAACSLDDGAVTLLGPSGGGSGGDAALSGDGMLSSDGNGLSTLDAESGVDFDDSAVAKDATALPDATSTPDAGACPAGQSLCPGTKTCVGNCTAQCGGMLSCDKGGSATCVADCAACGGPQTTACYRCPIDQGFNVTGSCEDPASGSSCVKNQGYVHCGCGLYNVSNCPGDNQVCRPTIILGLGACKSCGEDNTGGNRCKANGKCDVGKKICD